MQKIKKNWEFLLKINFRKYKSVKKSEGRQKRMKKILKKKETGITLIALVITIIFSYDENLKSSNNKGFLLQSI